MKKNKFQSFVIVLFLTLFIVLSFYFEKPIEGVQAKSNDKEEIIIDKGTPYEVKLPQNSISMVEPELINKPGSPYKDYKQDTAISDSLKRGYISASSTPVFDFVLDSVKTSKNEVISLLSHTNSNDREWWGGNPINVQELILTDIDGNIRKQRWILGEPDFESKNNQDALWSSAAKIFVNYTVSGRPSGTYTVLYSRLGGIPSEQLIFDENLNVISKKSIDSNGYSVIADYNRIGVDFFGTKYQLPYLTANNINKVKNGNFPVYSVSANAQYDREYQFRALESTEEYNYGALLKKYNEKRPDNWWNGIKTLSISRSSTGKYALIQQFSNYTNSAKRFELLVVYDNSLGGMPVKVYLPDNGNAGTSLEYQQEISTSDEYYFVEVSAGYSKLNKLDMKTNEITNVLEFPPNTDVKFSKAEDGSISLYGYTRNIKGIFQGYIDTPGVFFGTMNENFKLLSMSSLNTDVDVSIDKMLKVGNEKYFFDGKLYGRGFVDSVNGGVPVNNWADKHVKGSQNAFFGSLSRIQDYSPLIYVNDPVTMRTDEQYDTKLDGNNYTELDRLLITGNRNGNYNSPNAIKVYDNFDLNYNLAGYNQTWLNRRINRNPNDSKRSIDWLALGLDTTKVGGYKVNYFIADSQKKITTASKTVNVVSANGIETNKGFLEAENFFVTSQEAKILQESQLRNREKYAKLTAWSKDDPDDDLADLNKHPASNGVQIGTASEWSKINQAIPGKYELTISLTYGTSMKGKKINVFVSDKNVVGDYFFKTIDFELSWDISRNIGEKNLFRQNRKNFTVYKISTGEEITDRNPQYELRLDTTSLNACDPDSTFPYDVDASSKALVPVEVWTKGANPTMEVKATEKNCAAEVKVFFKSENLQLQFVDEDNNALRDVNDIILQPQYISLQQVVGKPLKFDMEPPVKEQIDRIKETKDYELDGYYKVDNKTPPPIEVTLGETNYHAKFKGMLRFVEIPKTMKFQDTFIRATEQTILPSVDNGSLIISDHRKIIGGPKGDWSIALKLGSDFQTTDGKELKNILYFEDKLIKHSEIIKIKSHTKYMGRETKTSVPLGRKSGIKLVIPPGVAQKGTYTATLQWELQNVP